MKNFTLNLILLIGTIFVMPERTYGKDFNVEFDTQDVTNKQQVFNSNTTLIGSTQSNKAWRLKIQALLHPKFLKAKGEIKYTNDKQGSVIDFLGRDNYLISLNFSGKKGSFAYGLSHYSLGKHYSGLFSKEDSRVKDRASNNIWLSYQFSDLTLKTKFSQLWTNLSRNSSQASSLEDNYSIESIYKLSEFPNSSFSVAYVIGNKYHFNHLNPTISYIDELSSVKTKFEIKHHLAQFLIDAIYLKSNNSLDSKGEYQESKLKVSSKLFPEYPLSIIPSFRFVSKKQTILSQQTQSNKTEPSLGLEYKPMYSPYRWKVTTAYL